MKKIKIDRLSIFYISLIIALSLITTLVNLGSSKSFIGEDAGVLFDFPKSMYKITYFMWDDLNAPGKTNISSVFGFLWSNLILLLNTIGLPPFFFKRLLFFAFFAISGIGFFFFLRLLFYIYLGFKKQSLLYFAAFVGSFFYMFNPFTLQLMSVPTIAYHLSYMLLPWLFLFFIYNLQVKTCFKNVVVFSVIFLFILNGNPSNTVLIIIFLFLYFVFFYNEIKKCGNKLLFFFSGSFIVVSLLTSYIYLPVLNNGTNPYGFVGSTVDLLTSLKHNSTFASFFNLFRMAGSTAWGNSLYYELYNKNIFLLLMGFLIVLLTFFPLLSRFANKLKIFFLTVILLSFFFAKGSHSPYGNLIPTLITKMPFLGMFRATYSKFIYFAVFSYSVLFSFSVIELYNSLKRKTKRFKFFLILIPFILIFYNYPFFYHGVVNKNFLTNIPQSYLKLPNSLNGDLTDFKILSLPPAPKGAGLLLRWSRDNYYVGPHPDMFFFDRPVIDGYWFIRQEFFGLTPDDSWTGARFEKQIRSILNYAPILNIKYVLVHKDFVNKYSFGKDNVRKIDGTLKANVLKKELVKIKGLKLIEDNSYFALYELPESYFLEHIYIPNLVLPLNKNKPILLDKKKALTAQKIKLPKYFSHTPDLEFVKINPTKYQLKISKANGLFPLVFSETYDKGWKIYQSKTILGSWFSQPIFEKDHIIINGYANAWLIDPNKLCQDSKCKKNADGFYDINLIVEFLPQRFFYIGLFISSLTLIVCLLYLIYNKTVRR